MHLLGGGGITQRNETHGRGFGILSGWSLNLKLTTFTATFGGPGASFRSLLRLRRLCVRHRLVTKSLVRIHWRSLLGACLRCHIVRLRTSMYRKKSPNVCVRVCVCVCVHTYSERVRAE